MISQPGAERPPAAVRGRQLRRRDERARRSSIRTAERAVEIQAAATTADGGRLHPAGAARDPVRARRPGAADRRRHRRGRDLVGGGAPAAPATTGRRRSPAPASTQFGRAIQSAVDALDDRRRRPRPRARRLPRARRQPASGLGPGAARAGADPAGAGRGRRRLRARRPRASSAIGTALAWARRAQPAVRRRAGGRSTPLALVGAIPRPPFPFDPGLYELGARAVISFVIMLAAVAASAWFLRSPLAARRAPEVAPRALGALAALSCALLWLANPYLALLAAPAAHVWVLAVERPSARSAAGRPPEPPWPACCRSPRCSRSRRRSSSAIDAPWTFTLMVADGQIGLLTMVAAAFLAGTLIALVALACRRRGSRAPADAQESSTDV